MSPEGKEYLFSERKQSPIVERGLYRYVQKERPDRENEKAKRVVNAPKNWGTSHNKARSVNGVWRK